MNLKDEIKKLEEWKRLTEYEGKDRVVSSEEVAEELSKTKENTFSFNTKVPSLDRILNGVESGELIIVTGPTGGGKTTLLTSITSNIASEIPVVWFTLEMTNRQFLAKFDTLPHFFMPAENVEYHVQWLIERIAESVAKYNVKMVFIDHLHEMLSLDHYNGKNMSLEIGDVVAKIKHLAIQYNLVIWLVAHSTDDKNHYTREPRMSDVRDSGMITRIAHTVMGVWRIPNDYLGNEATMGECEESDTHAKVRIWKNRREGTRGYLLMEKIGKKLVELTKDFLPGETDSNKKVDKSKYHRSLYPED